MRRVSVSVEAIAVVYRKSEEAIDQSINRQRSERSERKKGRKSRSGDEDARGRSEGGGRKWVGGWDAPQKNSNECDRNQFVRFDASILYHK